MSEMMRDVQADDAKLRRLSVLGGFFGRMMAVGILGLVFAFVPMFIFTDLAESLYPFVAGGTVVFFIFVGAAGGYLVDRSAKKIAASYTPTVLSQVMDRLDEYDPKAGVDTRFLDENLGFPHYDRLGDYGDYVEGVFRGAPVRFGEFELEEEREERSEHNGVWETVYYPIFRGLMVLCRHNLQVQEDFTISSYVIFEGPKTGDSAFDEAYSICAERGGDALRLLTPSYRQALMNLAAELGEVLALRFHRDGTLIVALKDWNLLEEGESESATDLTNKMEQEVRALGDVLMRLGVAV